MMQMSLQTAAKELGISTHFEDCTFHGVSSDTRTLIPKNLFVAISGEQFDGHDFVIEAFKKGASAALVNRKVDCEIPQLIVPDTLLALGKLAEKWRDSFSIPLIGVTGSNGKTTLKNMIASILRSACGNDIQVLATEGNLNNNIGLPLMLARLSDQHRFAVIEMGMNHFGEIDYLTRLAKPTIAVINNAAEAHLEGVGDIHGVAKAKGEIFLGLDKKGIAILNRDDAHYSYWQGLIGERKHLSFGLHPDADVTAVLSSDAPLFKTPQGEISLQLSLLGKHNILNALAATAVTLAAGIELTSIKKGLEKVKPAHGRMELHTLPNGTKIIDDTYNANPSSLQAAIDALANFSGKKILVLGDMKELGSNAKELHSRAGEKIRVAGIDYLFTYGNLSAATTEAFGKQGQHFSEREKLLSELQAHLTENTIVLVKGSRSMKMEKIIAGLIPESVH